MNLLLILLLIFNLIPPVSTSSGRADVWPGFRGAGDSHTAARELPLEWADDKNVAWDVALPGYGQSSPVVWRDKVFLTAVEGANKEKLLVFSMEYGLICDIPSENSRKGDILMKMKHAIFSTCCLALFSISAMAQTAEASSTTQPQKADPAAWNTLKSARETSQTLPTNFAGVTVDVVLNDNGKLAKGSINYEAGKSVEMKIEGLDDEAKGWLNDQTMSIIAHRRGGDFSKGDGRHPITFAEDDNSPAGRRIAINDQMKSHYRVRDNKVVEVDRTMGSDHFIINVLETTKTPEGKNLPRHFTVTYFDAKSGAVKRTETFTDEYKLIDGVWFPASRRMFRAENGKVITRVIEFHNPRIRFTNEQAAR